MKTMFIGDVHGASLKQIYDTIREEVDLFCILGDLDRIYVVEELADILEKDRGVFFVPGNHDYAHINRQYIYSRTMNKQDIDSPMMWGEWKANKELSDLIASTFDNTYNEKYPDYKGTAARRISIPLPDENLIMMHGAYYGEYCGEPDDLWNRLETHEDYEKNFKVMERKGYDIMFRGHDHNPELAKALIVGNEKRVLITKDIELNTPIDISDAHMATITVGALHNGYYVIYNTKNKSVTFYKNSNFAFKRSTP